MSTPNTTPTTPLTGARLLRTAVNQILKHPETWRQQFWHSACGTKHCIAGWCQILAGKPADDVTAKSDAQEALGITDAEANGLFRASTTLPEIHYFATHFEDAGYDRDGYSRAGYDRAGYDRAGYDRAGYDRAGYSRDGYDRDGYDRDGYDRDAKLLPLFEL